MLVYVIVIVLSHQGLYSVQSSNNVFRNLEDCQMAKDVFLEILRSNKPTPLAHATGNCVTIDLGSNT